MTVTAQMNELFNAQIENFRACLEIQGADTRKAEAMNQELRKAWGNGLLTTKTPKTSYPNLFNYGK